MPPANPHQGARRRSAGGAGRRQERRPQRSRERARRSGAQPGPDEVGKVLLRCDEALAVTAPHVRAVAIQGIEEPAREDFGHALADLLGARRRGPAALPGLVLLAAFAVLCFGELAGRDALTEADAETTSSSLAPAKASGIRSSASLTSARATTRSGRRAGVLDRQGQELLAGRTDLYGRVHLRTDVAVEARGPAADLDVVPFEGALPALPIPRAPRELGTQGYIHQGVATSSRRPTDASRSSRTPSPAMTARTTSTPRNTRRSRSSCSPVPRSQNPPCTPAKISCTWAANHGEPLLTHNS